MISPLNILLALAVPLSALAKPHASPNANMHHRDLALRARGDLQKRFSDTRFTYYAVGLGACGKYNQPSDFVSIRPFLCLSCADGVCRSSL
jgi:hypothetical protein